MRSSKDWLRVDTSLFFAAGGEGLFLFLFSSSFSFSSSFCRSSYIAHAFGSALSGFEAFSLAFAASVFMSSRRRWPASKRVELSSALRGRLLGDWDECIDSEIPARYMASLVFIGVRVKEDDERVELLIDVSLVNCEVEIASDLLPIVSLF